MKYCLPSLFLLICSAPCLALRVATVRTHDIVASKVTQVDLALFHWNQLAADREMHFGNAAPPKAAAEEAPCGKSIGERLEALEHINFLDHPEEDKQKQCLSRPSTPLLRYRELQCQDQDYSKFVYVDLGARTPTSSVQWFLENYQNPSNKSFKIHAFEADPRFKSQWAKDMPDVDYNEAIVSTEDTKVDFEIGPDGMGRMVSNPDGGKFQAIDFDRWIRQNVKDTDFVVVKMDIEGVEHALIEKMISSGAIKLVDELFVECHYNRYNCQSPERTKKWTTTWDDCKNFFGDLRSNKVWAHSWI